MRRTQDHLIRPISDVHDTHDHVDAPRECNHERSHVVDSAFHRGGYSTPESRRIFCDVCRLQRWLDIEVALAQSQAEMEMIPYEAAAIITRAARIDRLDAAAISAGIITTGHSLVPLLRALQAVVGSYSSQFVHHGATTQDIQDTGQSLEMRDTLDIVERNLITLLDRLDTLAVANRLQLTVGRTHAQPALPTTFGLKVAGWIDELTRHVCGSGRRGPRILVAQMAGGVGTMAAFRGRGPALLARFAAKLGLAIPDVGGTSAAIESPSTSTCWRRWRRPSRAPPTRSGPCAARSSPSSRSAGMPAGSAAARCRTSVTPRTPSRSSCSRGSRGPRSGSGSSA